MKRAAIVALGLLACQPTVKITPASPESTRSVLIVSVESQSIAAGEVRDLEASTLYRGDGPLEVISFGCNLARLGILPGIQDLDLSAAGVSLLPDALGVRASDDPAGGDWRAVPTPSADAEVLLRRLPVSDDNRCLASRTIFAPEVIEIGLDRGDARFGIRADGQHALLGAKRGVFLVGGDGSEREIEVGDRSLLAAFHRDDEADYWFFDESGALLKGPLEGPLTVVTATTPVPRGPEYAVLAGAPAGSPFELYLATGPSTADFRGFARFDGQRWEPIAAVHHQGRFRAGVAWIAPDEAIAIGVGQESADTAVRYRRGAITTERLPGIPGDLSGPASIAHLPNLGTYVGRDNGELDHYERGDWINTGFGLAPYYTRTIAPNADGLIYGTGTMLNFLGYRFAQYFQDLGACPLEMLTDFAAFHLVVLDDGSMVASTVGDFDGSMTPVVLHRLTPPRDCGPARQNSD